MKRPLLLQLRLATLSLRYQTLLVSSDDLWFYDLIVDAYFQLLQDRDQQTISFSVHFFNKWFGSKPKAGRRTRQTRASAKAEDPDVKYKTLVAKWGKKAALESGLDGIFKAKKLYIPVPLPFHWALVEVDFEQHMVSYFDSKFGDGSKYVAAVADFLRCEFKATNPGQEIPVWAVTISAKCPWQENAFDCGVFVCLMGDILSSGDSVEGAFSQDDLERDNLRIRRNILLDIHASKLNRSNS